MKPTVTTPTTGAEGTPKTSSGYFPPTLDERSWLYLFFPGVGAATLAKGGDELDRQIAANQFKLGLMAAILYFGIFLALSKQFKTPMLLKIAAAV